MDRRNFLTLAVVGTAATAFSTPLQAASGRRKIDVLAHRGASALRPEHTLASYAKAIVDGADYIEPDLVCSKDGVLVARHENEIGATTDVADHPEFAGRKTTKTIDGETLSGWFIDDFTLAELKTLRARERIPEYRPANVAYNGQFQIPTFEEIIELAAAMSSASGRAVGLIPELKHSTYFSSIGLPLEDRFLKLLAAHEYTRRAPLVIQSFEVANLRYLREKLDKPSNIRLMQLTGDPRQRPADVVAADGTTTFGDLLSPAGLKEMARYANVVAPPSQALIPRGAAGRLLAPSNIIRDAHAAGLLVHTWTFRPENRFLPVQFRGAGDDKTRNPEGSIAEMRRFIDAGIDGFFTDDPALGRIAVDGR